MRESIRRQSLSDVPIGISLSGGIDSSTIVSMTGSQNWQETKTFTLGFNEPWDETDDARFVAKRYGTKHNELILCEPVMKYFRDAVFFLGRAKSKLPTTLSLA